MKDKGLSLIGRTDGWGMPLVVLLVIAGIIEFMRPGSFGLEQLALICASAMILVFVATGETIVVDTWAGWAKPGE